MSKFQKPADETIEATGGGGGVDEKASAGVSITSPSLPDNFETYQKPNVPCFDFDPKTLKPNLVDGEQITAERDRQGVRVCVTSGGRKIFCCSISDYEEKFGQLPVPRHIYEQYYPNAK